MTTENSDRHEQVTQRAHQMLAEFDDDADDRFPTHIDHVDGERTYSVRGTGIIEVDVAADTLGFVRASAVLAIRAHGSTVLVDTSLERSQLTIEFDDPAHARSFAGTLQRRMLHNT